jgi:prepilin-type N-terminal cleavage/methylation domain-containing protein
MKTMKQAMHSESGFTLPEVLMAAAILVFGLMAYGVFSGNIINKNAQSRNRTLAAALAQEKLEAFRDQAHTGTVINTGTGSESVAENGTVAAGSKFTRTWTITNGGSGNLTTISVTVSWSGTGDTSVTLDTYISQ